MLSMLCLTFAFFLTEIIFGYVTNSLALIGDSYHMLSDVMALIVGITSLRMSKKSSRKNTFGWARTEVLGALINSVFLVALCFTIFVEAIQRLTHTHHIEHVDSMIYVGIAGLFINIIGLLLFCKQGQGRDTDTDVEMTVDTSTDQQTPDSDDSSVVGNRVEVTPLSADNATVNFADQSCTEQAVEVPQRPADTSSTCDEPEKSDETTVDISAKNRKNKLTSGAQLNMRAVFLHVLGDALGSVVVIISGLLIKFIVADWKYKIDPVLSLVLVCVIMSTTIPLLKKSALILMQTVPSHIKVAELKRKILEKVDGVCDVHELHVWQLSGNRIIATAHIRCSSLLEYERIAEQVKSFFHKEGIHSTTIQPEFVELHQLLSERVCALECGPDKPCHAYTCCARRTDATKLP